MITGYLLNEDLSPREAERERERERGRRGTGADEGVIFIIANDPNSIHWRNARCNRETDLDVYRSRDVTELNAPLRIGHR